MSDVLREAQQFAFQGFLNRLHEGSGCTVRVTHVADQHSMLSFSAGIRVLTATPLFNRDTGEVERWRHWMLFAEMGILDSYGGGHPVHCFECDVIVQRALNVELQEVGGTYRFLVCHNDPHEDDDRQAAVYRDWENAVEKHGGESAMQDLLDNQAHVWINMLRESGEMKS